MSRLSTRARLALGAAALVLVLLGGWFALLAPKRSQAAELDQQLAAARTELSQRRLARTRPAVDVKVRPSDLYRLTKALPSSIDMAGVILDVDALAARNALSFTSITPGAAVAGTGFVAQPVSVVVQGRFADVSSFLGDLRTLVSVRNRLLDARGRLYAVTSVNLGAPETGAFPRVKAIVSVNAYAFSPPPAGSTTAPPSTTSPSGGTIAAGAIR